MEHDIFGLTWFVFFYVISYIVWKIACWKDLGPLKALINGLGIIGVFIHELSHFAASLVMGVRPTGFKVSMFSERTGEVAPHGSVSYKARSIDSFLQVAVISLAPLYVSTWLFFWFLNLIFAPEGDFFTKVILGVLCASLVIGAAPSSTDLRNIGWYFKQDVQYSLYQVFVLSLAVITVYLAVTRYELVVYNFVYFVLIGIAYYAIKYFFIGLRMAGDALFSRKRARSSQVRYGRYTRKRWKPTNPKKLGLREPEW